MQRYAVVVRAEHAPAGLIGQHRQFRADHIVKGHGVGRRNVAAAAIGGDPGGAVELRRRTGPIGIAGAGDRVGHVKRVARQRGYHAGRGELADQVISIISHKNIVIPIHGGADGRFEHGGGGGAIGVAGIAVPIGQVRNIARQGGDHTRRSDCANQIIETVSHQEVAGTVQRGADGKVKRRADPRTIGVPAIGATVIAAIGQVINVPRQGGDHPGRGDLADQIVVGIRHIDIAQIIHGHIGGVVKPGVGAGTIGIAGVGGVGTTVIAAIGQVVNVPRQGGDHPGRGDLADQIVVGVGHKKVAGAIHGQTGGRVKLRRRSEPVGIAGIVRTVVTAIGQGIGVARQGGDHPGRGEPTDQVVSGIGNINVAGSIHGGAFGRIEPGVGPQAIGVTGIVIPIGQIIGIPRQCGHHAGRRDFSDQVIIVVSHIQKTVAVNVFGISAEGVGPGGEGQGRRPIGPVVGRGGKRPGSVVELIPDAGHAGNIAGVAGDGEQAGAHLLTGGEIEVGDDRLDGGAQDGQGGGRAGGSDHVFRRDGILISTEGRGNIGHHQAGRRGTIDGDAIGKPLVAQGCAAGGGDTEDGVGAGAGGLVHRRCAEDRWHIEGHTVGTGQGQRIGGAIGGVGSPGGGVGEGKKYLS